MKSLSRGDEQGGLPAEDLELLAVSAYMLGRDDEAWTLLERAHHAYSKRQRPCRPSTSETPARLEGLAEGVAA